MKKNAILAVVISALISITLLQTTEAQAWGRIEKTKVRRPTIRSHKYRSTSYGKAFLTLPGGFVTISFGGLSYQYHQGHFYRHGKHGYYVVHAPAGACVKSLPWGYRTIYNGGNIYYEYNGIYYRRIPTGYVVIENPEFFPIIGQDVKTVQADSDIDAVQTVTVNVPNIRGGYTAVTLTRSGEGFVGPQGEYYSEFPKIEQLKVMYGS